MHTFRVLDSRQLTAIQQSTSHQDTPEITTTPSASQEQAMAPTKLTVSGKDDFSSVGNAGKVGQPRPFRRHVLTDCTCKATHGKSSVANRSRSIGPSCNAPSARPQAFPTASLDKDVVEFTPLYCRATWVRVGRLAKQQQYTSSWSNVGTSHGRLGHAKTR